MPAWVLQVLLVALTLLSIARALKWLRYASSGFFTRQLLLPVVVVAAATTVGNALGGRLEYGVLVMCVGVSLAGVA